MKPFVSATRAHITAHKHSHLYWSKLSWYKINIWSQFLWHLLKKDIDWCAKTLFSLLQFKGTDFKLEALKFCTYRLSSVNVKKTTNFCFLACWALLEPLVSDSVSQGRPLHTHWWYDHLLPTCLNVECIKQVFLSIPQLSKSFVAPVPVCLMSLNLLYNKHIHTTKTDEVKH